MNEKEFAKFVTWLGNMIINSNISKLENQDDEQMRAYFQGRASAFQECLTDIQMEVNHD